MEIRNLTVPSPSTADPELSERAQALIDNLIERGLDPKVCRLFIVDGVKALSKVIRRTFATRTPIQPCQIHKARLTQLSVRGVYARQRLHRANSKMLQKLLPKPSGSRARFQAPRLPSSRPCRSFRR
jgi:hypothetical protein